MKSLTSPHPYPSFSLINILFLSLALLISVTTLLTAQDQPAASDPSQLGVMERTSGENLNGAHAIIEPDGSLTTSGTPDAGGGASYGNWSESRTFGIDQLGSPAVALAALENGWLIRTQEGKVFTLGKTLQPVDLKGAQAIEVYASESSVGRFSDAWELNKQEHFNGLGAIRLSNDKVLVYQPIDYDIRPGEASLDPKNPDGYLTSKREWVFDALPENNSSLLGFGYMPGSLILNYKNGSQYQYQYHFESKNEYTGTYVGDFKEL